jgi:hypothetical protein
MAARVRGDRPATMMRSRFTALLLSSLLALAATGCDDGDSVQRRAIGASCATSGQCGTGRYFCDVAAPDGDCEAMCHGDGDCPASAVCVGGGMILTGACLATCTAASDCRAGYVCIGAPGASHTFCAAPTANDGGVDAM